MNFRVLLISYLLLQIFNQSILAQCTIAPSDSCHTAEILCSASLLKEMICPMSSQITGVPCRPLLCSGTPNPQFRNASWYAFRSMGGFVQFVIAKLKCKLVDQGIQYGIWKDCSCGELLYCDSKCGSKGAEYSFYVQTEPCKVYYLFVAGCNGDVCDFYINAVPEKEPQLSPINLAPHLTRVCEGACDIKYEVQDTFLCGVNYVWTLDSVVLASKEKSIILDFPDSGSFQLCVTAYIGNPLSGNVCDEDGPICTTIRVVEKTAERRGAEGILCWNQIPYLWHNQKIVQSGEYRQTLQDSGSCCSFDSVRQFTVLERPIVHFVGCIGDSYTDTVTHQTFSTCQHKTLIDHPGKTMQYQCDSSYLLNAVFLNYNVQFREYCVGGAIVIEARPIDRTINCGNSGLVQDVQYKWYRKNDPGKRFIGNESIIETPRKDEYCVELCILANFGDQAKVCTFDFCEQWDESQFEPFEVCPLGDSILTDKMRGNYFLDSMPPIGVFIHNWHATGGNILTKNDGIDTTGIEVEWDPSAPVHKLCYQYLTNCGDSKECCLPVRIVSGNIDHNSSTNEIVIIPNPLQSGTRFKIVAQRNLDEIFIYDLNGRVCWSGNAHQQKSVDLFLDLNFSPGVYILKANCGKNKFFERFIVQP